ncbi:MAG TPA: hypothetical protein VFE35_05205 [Candidatus Cybelea sp.]|nr:hypothetical protein [Candidatus Cybelea sp.]
MIVLGQKGLDLLMPVSLGPHMSRFPARHYNHTLSVIRLKHSAFYEAFKGSDDVSDEIRGAIGERHTLVEI